MFARMWNKGNNPPLLMEVQTYSHYRYQYCGYLENWDQATSQPRHAIPGH